MLFTYMYEDSEGFNHAYVVKIVNNVYFELFPGKDGNIYWFEMKSEWMKHKVLIPLVSVNVANDG